MTTILLAVYNGLPYLPEQIRSILSQTAQDFTLHIRDDGSTDDSFLVAQEFMKKYPSKITISRSKPGTGSAKDNFWGMLMQADDDYIMFCDHDDVWLPDKIELTLAAMRELEQASAPGTPVLVHTDLSVVDQDLQLIDPSMFHMQGMDAARNALRQLLVQNIVTGCTVMINRPLQKLAKYPALPGMIMHDWWLALVATIYGKIGFIGKPTILYRQHSKNTIGAKDVLSLSYMLHISKTWKSVRENVQDTYGQAQALLDAYEPSLPEPALSLLQAYVNLPELPKLVRVIAAWRMGFVKNGILRKLVSILYL